jgi:hypothetical protein
LLEVLGWDEVDMGPEQVFQFSTQVAEAQQADARFDVNQKIDVTVSVLLASRHTAEHANVGHSDICR